MLCINFVVDIAFGVLSEREGGRGEGGVYGGGRGDKRWVVVVAFGVF